MFSTAFCRINILEQVNYLFSVSSYHFEYMR